MIETDRELAVAVQAYASVRGRFSARDLERDVTPQMSPTLLSLFNAASRVERYRAMLRAPKQYGLNQFVSLAADQYAHQAVLTFDEWQTLAEQTAESAHRSMTKLRRIAAACLRHTGQVIDVDSLIRQATAA